MPETLSELIRRILNPVIFGNIVIAVCALLLSLETYLQLQLPVRLDGLSMLVFFATLSLYNIHRLLVVSRLQQHDYSIVTAWAAQHRFTLFMLSLIGAGGVAFFVFQTSLLIFGILVVLGVVSLLYELPLIKTTSRFRSLRNLWIHKAFMITSVWTLATAFLPAMHAQVLLADYNLWLVLAERMLFIFLIALCFDARDVAFDSREGLRTIPILYGPVVTQHLYKGITAALVMVAAIHYFILSHDYGIGIAMILSAAITYLVISRTNSKQSDYFYILFVDGMMILQFLLVALMAFLF